MADVPVFDLESILTKPEESDEELVYLGAQLCLYKYFQGIRYIPIQNKEIGILTVEEAGLYSEKAKSVEILPLDPMIITAIRFNFRFVSILSGDFLPVKNEYSMIVLTLPTDQKIVTFGIREDNRIRL